MLGFTNTCDRFSGSKISDERSISFRKSSISLFHVYLIEFPYDATRKGPIINSVTRDGPFFRRSRVTLMIVSDFDPLAWRFCVTLTYCLTFDIKSTFGSKYISHTRTTNNLTKANISTRIQRTRKFCGSLNTWSRFHSLPVTQSLFFKPTRTAQSRPFHPVLRKHMLMASFYGSMFIQRNTEQIRHPCHRWLETKIRFTYPSPSSVEQSTI